MSSKSLTGASVTSIILSILLSGDNYGYSIIKRVRDLSGGKLEWGAGSLYPVMHRMKSQGLLDDYWVEREGERRRRYYKITQKGRLALEVEKQKWLTVHEVLAHLWGLPIITEDVVVGISK